VATVSLSLLLFFFFFVVVGALAPGGILTVSPGYGNSLALDHSLKFTNSSRVIPKESATPSG